MNVSCVIVTRGDVDLTPILEAMPIEDVVIWDNSVREDMGVWGRYCAIDECKHRYIYTQDDDSIVPVLGILSEYEGNGLMINVPADEERPWLAWGALFPREMPANFFRFYLEQHPLDEQFKRWCDVIFGELCFPKRVDLGHEDLPWATADNRMYKMADHYTSQAEVRERCLSLVSPW